MLDFSLASEFTVKSPASVAEPSYFTTKALEGLVPFTGDEAFPFASTATSMSPFPITKATPISPEGRPYASGGPPL